jgi:hypothetical protein
VLEESKSKLLTIKGIGLSHLQGFTEKEQHFEAVKKEEIF